MAKTNSTELSPEERLQQALVPEEERPYELPEGWKWVRIGDINCYQGTSVTPAANKEKLFELYSVPSFDGNYPEIIKGKDIGSSKQTVEVGDVLLCKINPRINRVWYVSGYTENELIASSEWIVIRNHGIESRYLMYCLRSQYFRQLLLSNVSGVGGSLMRAQPKFVKNYPIPIAPYYVQVQIADFIDKEFARLDKAQEQIQSVIDSEEERKQSILHKAFTGELTKKWRLERNTNLMSWKHMTLKEACNGLKYGTASKSVKEGNVAVIRMGNLQGGEIDWTNLVYSDNDADNAKYHLDPGAVLFNRTNSPELVGKTAIYRGEQPAIYAGYLIKLDYKEFLDGEFLNYIMNSPEEKYYCNMVKSDGVNQSNISAAKIGEFEIPVPSLDEQHEITRLLDRYFNAERALRQSCSLAFDQIIASRQSILSKDFSGALFK